MKNLDRIRAALSKDGPDALLVTDDTSRRWASGFRSTAGIALATREKAYFFIDSRYYEAAKRHVEGAEVRLVSRGRDYYAVINEALKECGTETLGFEEGSMTVSQHERFSEKLSARLVPAGGIIASIRAVKSAEELEAMKTAQRISEKSFLEALGALRRGMTERELAAELTCRMLKNGADDKSFDPIIVTGEHTCVPHGEPGDLPIGDGFLTMDFGVKKDGWCSDTTRTLCIGEPTEEMIRVYETVLAAQEAGIAAARAGISGDALDRAARDVIEKAGYGEYFGHAFGHGLGMDIHETPTASPGAENILPEGAVTSAEPGVYLPGKFGVRIEDVLYLTADGCENITKLPKKLQILYI